MKPKISFSPLFLLCIVLGVLGQPVPSSAQGKYNLDAITLDVGRYHFLTPNTADPRVFLIQDSHNLVSGQIESAVMIHRLIRDFGLTYIGVEGAFPLTSFDTTWFGSSLQSYMVPNIAVGLLGEGEINQGEFAALVYPDYVNFEITRPFNVFGIDDESYYNQPDPADEAFGELESAMLYTALAQLDDAGIQKAIDLVNQMPKEEGEALDAWREEFFSLVYTNNPNPRIQEWYAAQTAKLEECMTVGVDAEIANMDAALQIIRDFQNQTEELLGTSLAASLVQAESVRQFYENAHEREITMIYEIEGRLKDAPDLTMVATIGAAHTTWMEQALEADGYSTVVLSPESLCDETKAVALDNEAYRNKNNAHSVDMVGGLGSLLSALHTPKKPPVVLNEPWFQVKASAMGAAVLATEALRKDPNATLPDIFGKTPFIPGFSVDINSLQRVSSQDQPPRYVFSVNINIQGIPTNTLYIGILTDLNADQPSDMDLEKLLLRELDQVREKGEPEKTDPETLRTQIAPNVSAIFGSDINRVVEATKGI